VLFESVDKFFLNANSGTQSSGIYYIALTFASIFSSAKESIINAFTPWLFGNIKEKGETEIAKIMNLIFFGVGLFALGIAWFSKEALTLISSNPDFIQAYKYIPFTVMGLYIIFLGQLYNIKTFYYGKYNRYLFLATALGIVADIIACYFLVKPYGIQGAVISRVIAFTVHVVAIVYFSNMEQEKRGIYNGKQLTSIMIVTCIAFLLPIIDSHTIQFTLIKIFLFLLISSLFLFFLNKEMNLKLAVGQFLLKRKVKR
jgi:O-antigen/teichoic acid export membrane protein